MGVTEMVNKLPYLISLNRDESCVTTMLGILLFKHYAGYPPSFPLFGGEVLSRSDTNNCMNSFCVFWIGFREII